MELEKLLTLRGSLNEADKEIFDASYDTIINLFLKKVSDAAEFLIGATISDTSNFDQGIESAKIINSLGEKYGLNIKIPDNDKYLFFMYLLKIGIEVLKCNKDEKNTQPKEV